ncbi:MAG TPA: hypothetical protein VIJ92_02810 [Ginsengibacter sp.]
MEHSELDATRNRPEGDRQIDSKVLSIDIPSYIEQLKNENAWQENDRNAITVFKSDKMRIVLIALHRKAEIQTARPENVLSIQVLKGKIEVIADVKQTGADKGQIITLHDNVPYKIKALKKSLILLTVVE